MDSDEGLKLAAELRRYAYEVMGLDQRGVIDVMTLAFAEEIAGAPEDLQLALIGNAVTAMADCIAEDRKARGE